MKKRSRVFRPYSWCHLTSGGLSDAPKHYFQRSWRIKCAFPGCLAVRSLSACFRCRGGSPVCNRYNRNSKGSPADSGRVWGRSGVLSSSSQPHDEAQWRGQTSWMDLAAASNPCMWKCLSRLQLIHLEFWIIALMYRKYTAWSQHDS